MNNNHLPFQIGEHYENWEFDLEVLDVEIKKGYDSYIYIKETVFLGIKPTIIRLTFSLDILKVVTLKINLNSFEQYYHFTNRLKTNFTYNKLIQKGIINIEICELTNDTEILIAYKAKELKVDIIYGDKKLLTNNNILILLC